MKILRNYQGQIARGFIIVNIVTSFLFLCLELSFKSEIWFNYLWVPLFGLSLTFIGMIIEGEKQYRISHSGNC
jgi:hypothetical protein